MAEPESLATEETVQKHIRRHAYDRLIMLCDGIFAIATTLSALEIHLPEDAASFGEVMRAVGKPLFAYVVSFGVAAVFWVQNRDLFARLQRVDRVVTVLTLAMLCTVALIPAAIHGVYRPHMPDGPFHFYAATMMLCGLLQFMSWIYVALHPELVLKDVPRHYMMSRALLAAIMPLMFGVALTVHGEQLAFVVLPAAVAAGVLRRVVLRRYREG